MHSTVKWIFFCNLTEHLYKLPYKNMVIEGKSAKKAIAELTEDMRKFA